MKYAVSLFMLFYTLSAVAQEYNFSASTKSYQSISKGTELKEQSYFTLPIDFKLYGDKMDSMYLGNSPDISASSAIVSSFSISLSRHTGYTQKCEYVVDGKEGERIMKLQYISIKFLTDTTGADSTEAQIWLYEGSNKIELRYGASHINNPKSYGYNYLTDKWLKGISCGILTTKYENDYVLKGTPSNPKISSVFDAMATLTGYPKSGQVYTFTPKSSASIEKTITASVQCYPNPTTNQLFIDFANKTSLNSLNGEISIFTSDGKKCMSKDIEISEQPIMINVSHLPKGTYTIRGQVGSQYFSKSILVD